MPWGARTRARFTSTHDKVPIFSSRLGVSRCSAVMSFRDAWSCGRGVWLSSSLSPTGTGKSIDFKGDEYDGDFVGNKFHGSGQLRTHKGDTFQGPDM